MRQLGLEALIFLRQRFEFGGALLAFSFNAGALFIDSCFLAVQSQAHFLSLDKLVAQVGRTADAGHEPLPRLLDGALCFADAAAEFLLFFLQLRAFLFGGCLFLLQRLVFLCPLDGFLLQQFHASANLRALLPGVGTSRFQRSNLLSDLFQARLQHDIETATARLIAEAKAKS